MGTAPPMGTITRTPLGPASTLCVDVWGDGRGHWRYRRTVLAIASSEWERGIEEVQCELRSTLFRYDREGQRQQPALRKAEDLGLDLLIGMACGKHEAPRDDRIREATLRRGVEVQGDQLAHIENRALIRMRIFEKRGSVPEWCCSMDLQRDLQEGLSDELRSRGSSFDVLEWVGLLAMLEMERVFDADRERG